MPVERRPIVILLIDNGAFWQERVRASLIDSGQQFELVAVADPASCRQALERGRPDVILYCHAPAERAGHSALESTRPLWEHVPLLCLSEGAVLDEAHDALAHAYERIRADEVSRLPRAIERALHAARESSRQRRDAHAQALLAAHARMLRKAGSVHELLDATVDLPLGSEWKAIAIRVVDDAPEPAGHARVFAGSSVSPGVAAALERLAIQAQGDSMAGSCLRAQAEGSALFALPIGNPAWAVLTLVAAGEMAPEEDLQALATIAADIDQARDFLATREQAEHLALHHPGTGFPNRTAFQKALHARRQRGRLLVAMLDVDRFRQFNDLRGRCFGDLLLGAIGARLRSLLPTDALFGHLQDDDFLVAFDFNDSASAAVAAVSKLVDQVCAEPFTVKGESVMVGLRGSVLVAPHEGETADEIERSLLSALGEARSSGHLVHAVSEESRQQAPMREMLARELDAAISERQFELYLQPKFDATTRALSGAEALIRWRHPTRGLVPPALFIPLLEDSGMIIEVGAWVRSEGLALWKRWQQLGYGHLRLAVNVSSRELRHAGFIAGCEALLAHLSGQHGLDVEITESMLMGDIGRSVQVLQSLRELGCKIAIDDFGTGYSSLNYLSRLPADTLKIDQSFTAALVSSADALSMVTNIIGLAHSLGLSVVAEGVEQEEQASLLRLLRCDELQGYLLGLPGSAVEFERTFLGAPGTEFQAVPSRWREHARPHAGTPAGPAAIAPETARRAVGRRPWRILAASVAVLAVLASGWLWQRATERASRTDTAALLARAEIDSIAVLPFVDTSPGNASRYLAEGLSDELIDRLTRVPQLRVIARGSARAMQDSDRDAASVAQTLGVSSVLTGRLHRDGQRLSLDVELKGPDGGRIWSHSYRRTMVDLLDIEDEVARAVIEAMRVSLLPGQERALARRTATNPEAFNQYLLGRSFFRQSTPESFALAKSALEVSVALDPNFAPAHAELANTISYLADTADSAQAVAAGHARARALADKAVALDPQSGAGYRVRASLRALAFDFEGAMRDTVQALRLNGGDSDTQRRYGLLLLSQGRLDEALLATSRAAELDPLSANAYVVMGMIHNAQGDPQAAVSVLEKALKLTPGHGYAQGNLVQALLLKGDAAGAREVAGAMQPGMWRTFAIALAEHSLGNQALADAALRDLIETNADSGAYQIAEAHAWRGETDLALQWLQRAHRQHDGGLEQLKSDPLLRSLHADPRFRALVAELKLPA